MTRVLPLAAVMSISKLIKTLKNPPPVKEVVSMWNAQVASKNTAANVKSTAGSASVSETVWPERRGLPRALDPERPVLLEHFTKFTSFRHVRTKVPRTESQSPFENLSLNTYARMLSSPARMDIITRTIFPSDLLIRLCILEVDGDFLLSPVGYKDPMVFKGPSCYVSCSRSALGMIGKGRYLSIMKSMLYSGDRSEVRRQKSRDKNGPDLLWRANATDFYDDLMWSQIKQECKNLEPSKKPFPCDLSALEFLPEDKKTELRNSLPLNIEGCNALKLMILLKRYEMYNNDFCYA